MIIPTGNQITDNAAQSRALQITSVILSRLEPGVLLSDSFAVGLAGDHFTPWAITPSTDFRDRVLVACASGGELERDCHISGY